MADATSGSVPVIDNRVAPRGVLPRRTQTWLMMGLALGVLAIIVFAGHPAPAVRPASPGVATTALAPSPERLRDYQDRLRLLDERARQQAMSLNDSRVTGTPRSVSDDPPAAATPAAADPLQEDRKRRAYDSLFASNVVMTRRPDGQQLMAPQGVPARGARGPVNLEAPPTAPSIDDVADAVVRATTRYAGTNPSAPIPPTGRNAAGTTSAAPANTTSAASTTTPRLAATGPITSTGPLHRLLEGTVIDTVLTNRLDGSAAAPVNCLVTNAVYSHDGQYIVIPAGSRVLGETKPVQTVGETRLAVAFTRLALPDGRTYPLDQFMGLNEIGDAGLRDQVNQHYKATFGASAAVGLISGFAQYLSTAAFSRSGGDRTVIIAGNVGDATSQATSQSINRFLNRLPTVTIREGHRVKVYLTSDLELPPYGPSNSSSRLLLARTR
jgi:type IV secretory pathway VirB10-like protein